MKKTIAFLVYLILVCNHAFAAPRLGNCFVMPNAPIAYLQGSYVKIDGPTIKLAEKFYSTTTSAITAVDMYLMKGGTVTGINFKFEIQTDSSDSPSGTVLGAATAAWAGPAANGWIGAKNLVTNTGSLTTGTPYWIVCYVDSGTPDGSNLLSFAGTTSRTVFGDNLNGELYKRYDGASWSAGSYNRTMAFALTHADGTVTGYNISGTTTSGDFNSGTSIYSTNKQGIRLNFGAQVKIVGVKVQLDKVGSPGDLTLTVYEGATSKYSQTFSAANIPDNGMSPILAFDSPTLLAADTNIYIIASQSAGDSSNYYAWKGSAVNSTYYSTLKPGNFDLVYGSGSDPTAFTAETDFYPGFALVFSDMATEIDQATSGSGNVIIMTED